MDYYVVLGIPRHADADTIRSAFRTLARRYHPDAGEGSSTERFREIVIAYETLNHPTRRGDYDRMLRKRRASGSTVQFAEPLLAHAAPEPLFRPLSRVVDTNWLHNPRDQRRRLDAMLDEFFELCFGAPRYRDRV
jgi:curved DNA-binding protein CbpA